MPTEHDGSPSASRPRLFLTLGDVAGVGPEIVCRAWNSGELHKLCRPVIVGDPGRLRQTLAALRQPTDVATYSGEVSWNASRPEELQCLAASSVELSGVPLGQVDSRAGRAAYDFLAAAIQRTLRGEADGIVTAPLHKGALHAAGLPYPGHTEILAEWTGAPRFAMMLFGMGLGVAHVTLHMGLKQVFPHLTIENILSKIRLTHEFLLRLNGAPPHIGVCGLNPHAGDGGLFGDEEQTAIAPAVQMAQTEGIAVTGPWPSDTLFGRARRGDFQGVVAMYHDQGHIAMKLLAGFSAVNVSLGLPLVRTSVAHGTAFDIAAQFRADPSSLVEATRVAALLCGRAASGTLVGSPLNR